MPPSEPECASLVHRGLDGVELFDFSRHAAANLQRDLAELAAEGYTRLSLHAPMPRPAYFTHSGVSCFFLHEDEALRALSFRVVEDTLRLARGWGAAYVVTHLTYGRTDTANARLARRLAAAACASLAELSRRYEMPIDIEFAAYSKAFHAAEEFAMTLAPYPELGICLDIGHAWVGAQQWRRDYRRDIRSLAPRTRSMHLWNTRGPEDQRLHGHQPLHPSQTPGAGWIDVEETLGIVLACNPAPAIVFEYPVAEITADIRAGYDWVAGMLGKPAHDKPSVPEAST